MAGLSTRIWLWPNLLSLDAPLVAVLWQILFVRCFHAPFDTATAVLFAGAVWLIYSADRMLDAWRGAEDRPRHEFCRRYWRALLPTWAIVFVLTGYCSWLALSRPLFVRGVYLLAAVMVYFVAVHAAPARFRRWPKEAMVGVLFALGTSLAAWNRLHGAADIITVFLFSCLCWINCAAIEKWENRHRRWPVTMAAAGVAIAAILLLHQGRPILGSAESASALAFVFLDRRSLRWSGDALRVLADAALLSPIVFLPVTWLAA